MSALQVVLDFPDLPGAACATADPDVFYPGQNEPKKVAAARAVCAGCPVREACLSWSLEHHEIHGIWAGLAPHERRLLREGLKRCRGCGCSIDLRLRFCPDCYAQSRRDRQTQYHRRRTLGQVA